MALPEVCAHHIDYDPMTSVAKTGTTEVNLHKKFRGDSVSIVKTIIKIRAHEVWEKSLSERPDNPIVKELLKRSNLCLIEELQAEHKL